MLAKIIIYSIKTVGNKFSNMKNIKKRQADYSFRRQPDVLGSQGISQLFN